MKHITLNRDEIEMILAQELGKFIYLPLDLEFRCYDRKKVQKKIESDSISEYNYITRIHECEEFAFSVWCKLKRKFGGDAAVGVICTYNHCVIFYITDKKELVIIEPQNDEEYKIESDVWFVII